MNECNAFLHEAASKISSREFSDGFINCDDRHKAVVSTSEVLDTIHALQDAVCLVNSTYFLGDYKVNKENLEKYLMSYCEIFGYRLAIKKDPADTYAVSVNKKSVLVALHEENMVPYITVSLPGLYENIVYGFHGLYEELQEL